MVMRLMQTKQILTGLRVARRRRRVKKSHLVVETYTQEKKATDMKDEVSQVLNVIQITDSRSTNRGNVVMDFEIENTGD